MVEKLKFNFTLRIVKLQKPGVISSKQCLPIETHLSVCPSKLISSTKLHAPRPVPSLLVHAINLSIYLYKSIILAFRSAHGSRYYRFYYWQKAKFRMYPLNSRGLRPLPFIRCTQSVAVSEWVGKYAVCFCPRSPLASI